MSIATLSRPDFFVRLIGSLCQINRFLFHPALMLHRFLASQSGGESPMIVGLRSRRLSLVSRRRAVCSIGVAVQIIIAIGLAGCTGYSPGAKTFWNEEVEKLWERYCGVTI